MEPKKQTKKIWAFNKTKELVKSKKWSAHQIHDRIHPKKDVNGIYRDREDPPPQQLHIKPPYTESHF